ncbi:hypothetical protein BUE93_21040 [Chromobacterium amazonense]|uniref:Holin n=1 Tax=Chromobacterium amazonense TaxID=1382803 RepID=A0A2S9WYX4_9NEIS|nr:hypothetical protein [Chromobacterium amazonense]PRP68677.1 hypothetical protein BUE93_21040 [Chromobacterium amazonense]
MNWEKLIAYIVARMNEASSWAGLIAIGTAVGINLDPAQQSAILTGGVVLGGALLAALPDKLRGEVAAEMKVLPVAAAPTAPEAALGTVSVAPSAAIPPEARP